MTTITNISHNGQHYLIHVFYYDFSSKDVHAYSYNMLCEKIDKIRRDPKVHDFVIYQQIEFDLERY